MKYLMVAILCISLSYAVTVYEDFSDISGWTARCGTAYWYLSGGMVNCQTYNTCSAMVFPGQIQTQDGSISVFGSGDHTFGVIARLDNLNTGVYAYVSVDYNVARIRQVSNGSISTIYNSLNVDFPEGDYLLTFTCIGPEMSLSIEHVQSSQTWLLYASSEAAVQTGEWGIAAGETNAHWDWVELQYEETGIEEETRGIPGPPAILTDRNPFSGSVVLSVEGAGPGSGIEVFDISGRLVERLDLSPGFAVFTADTPSVYLARFVGDENITPVRLVCVP